MARHLRPSGLKVRCFCGQDVPVMVDEKGHLWFANHNFSNVVNREMCMGSNKLYRTAEQFKVQVLKEIQVDAKEADA